MAGCEPSQVRPSRMGTIANYSDAWADYSRRVRWLFGISLGGAAVLVVLQVAIGSTRIGEAVLSGLVIVWLIASAGAGLHLRAFRCPRCERKFLGYSWPVPERCAHCGLLRGR